MSKTTIKKLAYLLMEIPEGGLPTDDARMNYRVAKEFVRLGLAQAMRQKLLEDKNYAEDRDYLGKTVSEVKTVEEDTDKNYLYVDTIGESFGFGSGMGKYGVSFNNLHDRFSCMFVPITRSQVQVYKNMRRVPNVNIYYEDSDRLVFINGVSKGDEISVSQSNVIPEDDEAEVPSDVGAKAIDIAYKLAYPMMVAQTDRSNDGIPNN